MRSFVLLLTGVIFFTTASAQTTEDSVKAAVNKLFTGMRNADPEMIRNSFTDSAILQVIIRNKEGAIVAVTEPVEAFANAVAKMARNAADERITFDIIKIDGPLAFAWTPYHFYYEGKFSHCGVNSFQLLKSKGEWKIQYLIDTRRKQGCNP